VIDRTIEWQKLAATLEEVNRIRVHDVLNETYDMNPTLVTLTEAYLRPSLCPNLSPNLYA
jgi:hypothetical protein